MLVLSVVFSLILWRNSQVERRIVEFKHEFSTWHSEYHQRDAPPKVTRIWNLSFANDSTLTDFMLFQRRIRANYWMRTMETDRGLVITEYKAESHFRVDSSDAERLSHSRWLQTQMGY